MCQWKAELKWMLHCLLSLYLFILLLFYALPYEKMPPTFGVDFLSSVNLLGKHPHDMLRGKQSRWLHTQSNGDLKVNWHTSSTRRMACLGSDAVGWVLLQEAGKPGIGLWGKSFLSLEDTFLSSYKLHYAAV